MENYAKSSLLFLWSENYDVAKYLTDHNANVSLPNFLGQTPLHVASSNGKWQQASSEHQCQCSKLIEISYTGNKRIADLFVKKHANVDVIDNTGETPLLLAVKSSNFFNYLTIKIEPKWLINNQFRSKGDGWILDKQRCECEPRLSRWYDAIALCRIKRYVQWSTNEKYMNQSHCK